MSPTSTDEPRVLSFEDKAYLKRCAEEARETKRLAKAATRKLDSGQYNEAFVALLDVLGKWVDGGDGNLAIAVVSQAACHARKLRAPRDIIEAAEQAQQTLTAARKEFDLSPRDEEPEEE
jgi:hypothetical protein